MDIENFIAEFKKTFVYNMLKDYVTDEKLFDHFVTENGDIVFLKEQTRQIWSMWQAAKAHEAEKLKGCVVVPVEPTEAMIEAGNDANECGSWPHEIYAAMLEAARGGNE